MIGNRNCLQGCDLDLSPQLFSFCYLMILKYMIMVNLSARIEKIGGALWNCYSDS